MAVSSILNSVKFQQHSNLKLCNQIIKHLSIVIIVHYLTQNSVNECVLKERREGRRDG